MCASLATYPHEVVRTRLQTQRRLLDSAVSLEAPVSRLTTAGTPSSSSSNILTAERQSQKRGGIIYTVKKIVRKEGWRGLYKGLSINLIRTVPNSAVTMLTFVRLSSSLSKPSLIIFPHTLLSYELMMRQLSARDELKG